MEWHIITSSKGGIGKTLLALLLLAHNLDNKKKGSTLVLDLNGMNTDSSAILLYRKRVGKPINAELKREIETQQKTVIQIPQIGAEQIVIQKTYSLDANRQPCYYAVAYPLNPFGLYNPILFAELLKTIKNSADTIAKELDIPPLQQVIIDTNYHFCNLFGQDEQHYSAYTTEPLQEDTIKIWFMWVYRQLDKLIQQKKENEAIVVKLTAMAIENYLNQKTGENSSPFMHVFSPMALVSANPDEKNKKGVLTTLTKKLSDAITQNKDYTIKELEHLEHLSTGAGISFNELVEKLDMAHLVVRKRLNDDPHLLFLDILLEMVKAWDNKDSPSLSARPRNVIPLSVYQHHLQYYTDKERDDAVAKLREFKIYQNLSTLLNKK